MLSSSNIPENKDGKVGQDNSNSVEHGPFFRLKTSRDLPCEQALFLNFVLGSFKVILTKNKSVPHCNFLI